MTEEHPRKALAICALVDAIIAVGAMMFVFLLIRSDIWNPLFLFTDVIGYDDLAAAADGEQTAIMALRMNQAAWPLIIGTLFGVISLVVATVAKGQREIWGVFFASVPAVSELGRFALLRAICGGPDMPVKAAYGLGGFALLSAIYIWAGYGGAILANL